MISAVRDLVAGSLVPVVFDHFGGVVAAHAKGCDECASRT